MQRKPTAEEIRAAIGKTIPDIIAPDLQVLFCCRMEQGITKDLIAAGIPLEQIVLAFLPEEQTAATA